MSETTGLKFDFVFVKITLWSLNVKSQQNKIVQVTLPGKKQSSSTEVLDGHPFVIGVACLLHQYPDNVSSLVIRYLAQYVRSFYVEQTAQIQAFRCGHNSHNFSGVT